MELENTANNLPIRTESQELLPEHKAFVYEYLANGFNHSKAAETIGLAKSAGIRMLRKSVVKAEIARLQEENLFHSIVTKQFVESQYLQLLPKLSGEEEIPIVTPSGEQLSVKKFHSSEMTSVLRDLAKSSGYVLEEENKSNQVFITINTDAMNGGGPVNISKGTTIEHDD